MQQDIHRYLSPIGTIYRLGGNLAILSRRDDYHVLRETKGPHVGRAQSFISRPGFAAHGRAVAILNQWWSTGAQQ